VGKGIKVGHGGTLDPDATGLMVVFLGRATKLCDLVMTGEKGYEGVLALGISTITDDISGEIIASDSTFKPDQWSNYDFEILASRFRGVISQTPPRVSAVKIDGKRAYLRARNGEEFTINPKQVEIRELSLIPHDKNSHDLTTYSTFLKRTGLHSDTFSVLLNYRVRCSRGTYVRSLARDIGSYLGCGATIVSIRRFLASPFEVGSAIEFNEIGTYTDLNILPWHYPFDYAPTMTIDPDAFNGVMTGRVDILQALDEQACGLMDSFDSQSVLIIEAVTQRKVGLFWRSGECIRRIFL
jgi:tRNA pseudouridine55 synthase